MTDTDMPANVMLDAVTVPHMIKGEARLTGSAEVTGRGQGAARLMTPAINLKELTWPRAEPMPAADLPIAEIIDFLVETGKHLTLDTNVFLQEALEGMNHCSALSPRVLEACYRDLPKFFQRPGLELEIERALGGPEVLDGWKDMPVGPRPVSVRAFPPRLVHILAGNVPIVQPITIIRGALTKGVHLLKLPSNDLFTATAILRTMARIDPGHPTVRSISAVYWKGGDAAIESSLFRPQYFDKIIVWGGEAAVRHAMKYAGPGFEMISFDPKVSISMIGREMFQSAETIAASAQSSAADIGSFNQDACSASRFQFVEGTEDQVDAYCAELQKALARGGRFAEALGPPVPAETRSIIDGLRALDPIYRVFGQYDGQGVVVRSDEPVDFHPTGKVVNVVRVENLSDALRYVTVATQSVGIFPAERRLGLRDALAASGVQQIVALGSANAFSGYGGLPHDACWPINRFMHWVADRAAQ